ncbi:hypothetical protein HBI88_150270 [Parastagonospora nodorum]|nr:hypothetical protein HBI97_011590 [Parastagonospora nodorum]KAH5810639.1 hypothetical protein HBI94_152910 [Parastagonospora nodorum]KAH5841739.1 hypothetical protein HBI93_011740 [Parastagonospora nodorum]KAH5843954.1 hypothetical protein HBI96_009540 [Parastagonospora nodorum]KAH5855594.1 hypothetical protein HBI91_162070 [Parastagonospora nodorum]
MGLHEITVTDSATKKCSPSPSQAVTRLIRRFRKQTGDHFDDRERECNGPTFLHNLLPILEPFLLLNPRFMYIEDRILGRQHAPREGVSRKIPSSLDELKMWVEGKPTPCDCDKCAPWLYEIGQNSAHGAIQCDIDGRRAKSSRFSQPHLTSSYPLPKLNLRLYGDYEAMRLVRHHVAWLDKTYAHNTADKASLDVFRLRSLVHSWNPNLTGQDMRSSASSTQMLQLVKILNKVFFFGAIPSHRQSISSGFAWLPDTEKTCFGIGTFNPIIGTQVLLHPKLYRHHGDLDDLDVRWRNRLGTILHELCHAFLKAYTCRSCPTHDSCIGPRGHGRAWQILAAKMEEVATKLLGVFVDFGRYPSLLHDLEGNGKLPSKHDLDVLRFGTRWLV